MKLDRNNIHIQWNEKIGIGCTNVATLAMETKKGGSKRNVDSFHHTS
jgi:hypothetical protein